jgi:hypothetical protein
MIALKRTIIVVTMFFGSLLPARADNTVYTGEGRVSEAPCLNTYGAQANASVTSRNATPCSRGRGRRQATRAIPRDNEFVCIVDVLYSEELTSAPIFYHLVRATLRITPPSSPAFETVVTKMIHWQVPPSRQGQRLSLWCDPASLSSLAFH